MSVLKGHVGRKIAMSVTGLSMAVFVLVHLLGNTSLYAGADGINAYASVLHRYGFLLWPVRLGLALFFLLHVYFGIQLTLEDRDARPKAYAVRANIASTFAGRTMIWTGLVIGTFVGYHLLHFTFQVISPDFAAGRNPDAFGRPDVFMMVVRSFQKVPVSGIYLIAMGALGLHLMHSIQSSFQTLGLNSDRSFPVIVKAGALVALLVFLGFASFPITVVSGILGQGMR